MRRVMLIVLSVIVGLVVIYSLIPSKAFSLFKTEVEKELSNHPPTHQGVFTEQDIASLPDPVQRYFRHCGFIGKPKMTNGALDIERMQLKLDLKKDFFPVKSYQLNAVVEPARIVYLKAKMFGVIPFDGRDKYWNNEGNMFIQVMKLFTVQNVTGMEMDKSTLVTVLAETFMVPSYALQPYINWTAVHSNAAKATLSHQGVSVSGTFYFNDAGEVMRFETNDRYMSQPDGTNKNTKWITFSKNYQERNGYRIPTEVSAAWVVNGVEKEYGNLKLRGIRYDVTSPDHVMMKRR